MNSNISQIRKEPPSRDVCLIIRCDHIQMSSHPALSSRASKGIIINCVPKCAFDMLNPSFQLQIASYSIHTSLHHSKHPPLYSFMIEWCCQPFLDLWVFIIIEVELFHLKVLLKMCKYVLLRERNILAEMAWYVLRNLQSLILYILRDWR